MENDFIIRVSAGSGKELEKLDEWIKGMMQMQKYCGRLKWKYIDGQNKQGYYHIHMSSTKMAALGLEIDKKVGLEKLSLFEYTCW